LAFVIQRTLTSLYRSNWFGKFSETFSTPREFKIYCLAFVIHRTLESVYSVNVGWQLPEHIQTDQEKNILKLIKIYLLYKDKSIIFVSTKQTI